MEHHPTLSYPASPLDVAVVVADRWPAGYWIGNMLKARREERAEHELHTDVGKCSRMDEHRQPLSQLGLRCVDTPCRLHQIVADHHVESMRAVRLCQILRVGLLPLRAPRRTRKRQLAEVANIHRIDVIIAKSQQIDHRA